MSKKRILAYLLFALIALTIFVMVYFYILGNTLQSLIDTLKTLDIYSVEAISSTVNPPYIVLNLSLILENRARYTVTVDSIQMKVYISNTYLGSVNPYKQITSFNIPPNEKCLVSFTCTSNNQKIIEVASSGKYIIYGNGTIMGRISHYFFISVSYTHQFSVEKSISERS
ncbi:MAG: hypothetical protein ACQXXG_05605 [Candidatus Bathyarchaeia archaeon]